MHTARILLWFATTWITNILQGYFSDTGAISASEATPKNV